MPAKPAYRLQALLGIRERAKENAEHHLAECLSTLKKARDKLKEMEQELERMIKARQNKQREFADKTMTGKQSAQDVIDGNQFIERMKKREEIQQEAITGQKAVCTQHEQDVADARNNLLVANQALKAIEKHRDNWLKQRKKIREAKDEAIMDDLAQDIFRKNQHK